MRVPYRTRWIVGFLSSALIVVVVFSANFASAENSRMFLRWTAFSGGMVDSKNDDNQINGSLGITTTGTFSSDKYKIELGYYKGSNMVASAYAKEVSELSLTPISMAHLSIVATASTSNKLQVETEQSEVMPTTVVNDETVQSSNQLVKDDEDTTSSNDITSLVSPTVEDVDADKASIIVLSTATSLPLNSKSSPGDEKDEIRSGPGESAIGSTDLNKGAKATPFVLVITPTPSGDIPKEIQSSGSCNVSLADRQESSDLGYLLFMAAPAILWKYKSRR